MSDYGRDDYERRERERSYDRYDRSPPRRSYEDRDRYDDRDRHGRDRYDDRDRYGDRDRGYGRDRYERRERYGDRYGRDRDRGDRGGYRRERRRSPPKRNAIHERDPAKMDCRVYVWNLSYRTKWTALKDHFKEVGEVAYADVIMDRQRNRSKGCGVVEFTCPEDAKKAIDMMFDTVLDDRKIAVREDRPAGADGYVKRPKDAEDRLPPKSDRPAPRAEGGDKADNPGLEKKMDDDLDNYFASRPDDAETAPAKEDAAPPAEAEMAPAEA